MEPPKWLENIVIAYVYPIKLYSSEGEILQYLLKISAPLFTPLSTILVYNYFPQIPTPALVFVGYIASVVLIGLYELFLRIVLFFSEISMPALGIYFAPLLSLAGLVSKISVGGIAIAFIVIIYLHYLIARTIIRHKNMNPARASKVVVKILLAKYIIIALTISMNSWVRILSIY